LQLSQERHWNSKNHDIGSDIQCRVREPESKLIHAMSRKVLVPERSYRDAHEHTSKYGPASVANQDANHDLTELVGSARSKDTHVLADDGKLG
jgi:hypothetical protein